jgi:hypothetical protein
MLFPSFRYDSSPHISGPGRALRGVGCLSVIRAENRREWESIRRRCYGDSYANARKRYAEAYSGGGTYAGGVSST